MGKKCIPGLFCIENMTLFILIVIFIMIVYLYYIHFVKLAVVHDNKDHYRHLIPYPRMMVSSDPMIDLYAPPMSNAHMTNAHMTNAQIANVQMINVPMTNTNHIPVNIRTRPQQPNYQQVGILTRGAEILPLMGRKTMNGRDKWQYYTMTNTGNLNTKLPVSLNGKSCTGEYGCDDINNGDMVYVEGYNDTFRVTMYENSLLQYLPY